MTHLDGLMLTGKWLKAIRYVRTGIYNHKLIPVDRAILLVGLRAYGLGILDGAPRHITRSVDDSVAA